LGFIYSLCIFKL